MYTAFDLIQVVLCTLLSIFARKIKKNGSRNDTEASRLWEGKNPIVITVQEAEWSKNKEVGLRERCGVSTAIGASAKKKNNFSLFLNFIYSLSFV